MPAAARARDDARALGLVLGAHQAEQVIAVEARETAVESRRADLEHQRRGRDGDGAGERGRLAAFAEVLQQRALPPSE